VGVRSFSWCPLEWFRVVSRRYPAVTASDAVYALLDNSRTADVWASEVVAQWQQQQQLAAGNGTLNKVIYSSKIVMYPARAVAEQIGHQCDTASLSRPSFVLMFTVLL
jgi:hypothetical protein